MKTQWLTIFDIDYNHIILPDGDELYLTHHGQPFMEHLHPHNFLTDKEWFKRNSVKLSGHSSRYSGTSSLFKITGKPIRGIQKEVVLKWNRMGQDIPGMMDNESLMEAEFNSPFEEFSLVIEMRNIKRESPGSILTHRPLAIYVPARNVHTVHIAL
jgi:hypothetical protein